jgi:hypothetical protein
MAINLSGRTTLAGISLGLQPSETFRYFRLDIQSYVGGNIRVSALRARVDSTDYPTGNNMTSNTTPSPLVASSSAILASFEPWQAFASAPGSGSLLRWIAETSAVNPWLQIDLGAGNEIAPTAVLIGLDGDSGASIYIENFTFSGSNTGAFAGEQTLLYTSPTLDNTFWTTYVPEIFTF